MSWDSDRVRIELCDVMSIDPETLAMTSRHAAEIWLSDDDGKIRRTRKPAALLIGDTRPDVLRQLAHWIESRDDPSLSALVLGTAEARRGDAA